MANNDDYKDSILISTRVYCGIVREVDVFDDRLIPLINSAFATLYQLGLGDVEGFEIEDETAKWSDVLHGKKLLNLVKSYVHMYVQLVFDPPNNSFATESVKERLKEYEWRINVILDPDKTGGA